MDNTESVKTLPASVPIFITGYMASGKTTFGRALARVLRRDFIDLDFYIMQRFRTTMNQFFAERGEDAFRAVESEMLREVGEFENVVVACGGGTPCFNGNMDYMNSRGLTIFLNTPTWRIIERLKANSERRPLMAGKSPEQIEEAVIAGLKSRNEHYSKARIHFSGEKLEDRRQISNSINDFLARHVSSTATSE